MIHHQQFRLGFAACLLCIISATAFGAEREELQLNGITEPVEIIKDKWGISHIYAQNQADLFFAQGYNAARDRLFQFEMWRRRATGTLAEIQGEKALAHDEGARLLRFRGDPDREFAHYHENGREIIFSFVAGVNTYIEQTRKNPDLLPFEFDLLDISPGLWSPEIVISRHNALTGGISSEIMLSKMITALGAEMTRATLPFYRNTHLRPFSNIDLSKINDQIMAKYRASRTPPKFQAGDLKDKLSLANSVTATPSIDNFFKDPLAGINTLGSNNWVISGSKTLSGKPIMANDPHRAIESPSLRYMVHLSAPAKGEVKGWNVIGGGEPVLPGISIGHNEHGAWGLTIFRIDQEDLYVYNTNPKNHNQYYYDGRWENFKIEKDTIKVRDKPDVIITLKYSRHGPVLFEDAANNLAYGLKAAWLDIGATPYLASLRMNQATTWEEFRNACSFSGLPGENMVWADKYGNIGWQSVGLSPVRFGWDGSLPIPGDGSYEWAGYVPIKSMPHVENPESGWYGTANNHNVPEGYPNIFSDFYSDPARSFRLNEVLTPTRNHTIEDSMALQYDNKSMTAEGITPYLKKLNVPRNLRPVTKRLISWNHMMNSESVAAAIYDKWEIAMLLALKQRLHAAADRASLPGISKQKLLEWVIEPPEFLFGKRPQKARNKLMLDSLSQAVNGLKEEFGAEMINWTYGSLHFAEIIHPLSHLLDKDMQATINIGPLPRGGASNTLNANHGAGRQRAGASFRLIVDTDDWDLARGTNTPGQSGDPRSPFYGNTFENWNEGEYFPVYYSRDKVNSVADKITVLQP